jgi:hypothetical protein
MATADEIKAYEGLTEKNFAQCKELFAHQIAAEVIGKIKVALGIFAVLLTAAGVFSLPAYVDGKVTKQVDEELKRQKDRLVEAQVAFAAQAALFDSRAEEIRRLTDDARSQLKKVDELQSDVLKQTEQIAKLDKMAQEAQGASLKAVGCAKEAAEKAKDVTDKAAVVEAALGKQSRALQDAQDLIDIPLFGPEALTDKLKATLADVGIRDPKSGQIAERGRQLLKVTIEALGRTPFPQRLHDRKQEAARYLKAILERPTRPDVIDFTQEDSRAVRAEALFTLRRFALYYPEQNAGIDVLIEVLGQPERYTEQNGAAWALGECLTASAPTDLGRMKVSEILSALVAAVLSTEDQDVREFALMALERAGHVLALQDKGLDQRAIDSLTGRMSAGEESAARLPAVQCVVGLYRDELGLEGWGPYVKMAVSSEAEDATRSRMVESLAESAPSCMREVLESDPALMTDFESMYLSSVKDLALELRVDSQTATAKERWPEAEASLVRFLRLVEKLPAEARGESELHVNDAKLDLAELYLITTKYGEADVLLNNIERGRDERRTRVIPFLRNLLRVLRGGSMPTEFLNELDIKPFAYDAWSFEQMKSYLRSVPEGGMPEKKAANLALDFIEAVEAKRPERKK